MKTLSRIVLMLIVFISVYFVSLFVQIDTEPELSVKPDIKFDYRYEQFFPKEDESLKFFNEYTDEFDSDNDFIVLALYNNEGLFERDFLLRLDSLRKDLEALPHIELVQSITNLTYPKMTLLEGVKEYPFVNLNSTNLKKDSINIYQHDLLVNSFVSSSTPVTSIFVKTESNLPRRKSIPMLASLDSLEKEYEFDGFHKAGRIIAQSHYMYKLGNELTVFMSLSILLLIVFLWITFRTWWGIVIPLIVVLLSILWTMAFMYFSGKAFDMLMVLLPTIIFVVGMSDVIHILSKYLEELRKGKEKYLALKIAFKEVGLATFLTSLTTAVGFYALLVSSIQPIKDFGWYTGGGVFISYLLAFSLFPSVLLNVPKPKIVEGTKWSAWDRWLLKVFQGLIRNRKKVLLANGALLILAIIGASQLKIENFLLEDLSKNDPIKQDVDFMEENLLGIRPVEISLQLSNSDSLWTVKSITKLNELDVFLKEIYGLNSISSPISIVKGVNQALRGGKSRYYRFPKSDDQLKKVISFIQKSSNSASYKEKLSGIIGETGRIRISGKINDLGARAVNDLNLQFDDFLIQNNMSEVGEFRVTGTADLIDENNEYLSTNMVIGLLIAFLIIGLIVIIIFKSLKMTLISWLVNLVPLIAIAGIMGYFDIDLRISTSLIFSIAFGIAVDDTIHFLMRYKLELVEGRTNLYAIKRSFISTGKAIIMTSIMLCSGFVTLIFSDFMSTFHTGLLVAVTLFVAVIVDLTLLPILLLGNKDLSEPKT